MARPGVDPVAQNTNKAQGTSAKRGVRKPPTFLRERERDALLAIVDDRRDHGIISLFLYGGLRLNELRMLDRSDVDFTERTVMIRFAKRGKWRMVRLHAIPEASLLTYLPTRIDEHPALFVANQTLNRMAPRTIQMMLDRYTTRLDWTKRVTPHCLRHTFATALFRQCKDLRIVQRALGHSSITTTTIYAHLADDEMYGAIDQL